MEDINEIIKMLPSKVEDTAALNPQLHSFSRLSLFLTIGIDVASVREEAELDSLQSAGLFVEQRS